MVSIIVELARKVLLSLSCIIDAGVMFTPNRHPVEVQVRFYCCFLRLFPNHIGLKWRKLNQKLLFKKLITALGLSICSISILNDRM